MIFDRVDSIWPDGDKEIAKDKWSSIFFCCSAPHFVCMAGVVVLARPVLGSPWHRTIRIIMQLMASLEDPA